MVNALREAIANLDPYHVAGAFLLIATVGLILPSLVVNVLAWLDRRWAQAVFDAHVASCPGLGARPLIDPAAVRELHAELEAWNAKAGA